MELGELLLLVTELIGTVAFAISGAMVGIEKRLDLLGVVVLGISTAVGGGAVRDVLLGRIPPMMFQKSVYVVLAIFFSILTFAAVGVIGEHIGKRRFYRETMNFFDAAGLGIFAATSVNLVLSMGYRKNLFMAVFMGTVTAVGGGVLRDVMVGKVPLILRKRIYALAAILGSIAYYGLYQFGIDDRLNVWITVGFVVAIRLLAAHYEWNLPKAPELRWTRAEEEANKRESADRRKE